MCRGGAQGRSAVRAGVKPARDDDAPNPGRCWAPPKRSDAIFDDEQVYKIRVTSQSESGVLQPRRGRECGEASNPTRCCSGLPCLSHHARVATCDRAGPPWFRAAARAPLIFERK
jgi:hypothetical protein